MAIRSYRDLRVWNAGMDLVERVYGITGQFPQEEMFGLTSQSRRAAVSVPSNIAEGHTREHRKEFLQHISTGQASLAELETLLEIAARLGYAPREHIGRILHESASLGRQLYALRNALKRKGPEVTRPRTKRKPRFPTPGPRPLTPAPRRNNNG